jgi:hypothetical protein
MPITAIITSRIFCIGTLYFCDYKFNEKSGNGDNALKNGKKILYLQNDLLCFGGYG